MITAKLFRLKISTRHLFIQHGSDSFLADLKVMKAYISNQSV